MVTVGSSMDLQAVIEMDTHSTFTTVSSICVYKLSAFHEVALTLRATLIISIFMYETDMAKLSARAVLTMGVIP